MKFEGFLYFQRLAQLIQPIYQKLTSSQIGTEVLSEGQFAYDTDAKQPVFHDGNNPQYLKTPFTIPFNIQDGYNLNGVRRVIDTIFIDHFKGHLSYSFDIYDENNEPIILPTTKTNDAIEINVANFEITENYLCIVT